MKYSHILFDLDGTLVDSLQDLANAVNHARRELGLSPLPVETVCGFVGEGARLLVERSLGPDAAHRTDEALAIFLPYYASHLLDHTVPYPGMAELLAELDRRGAWLAVLTNKPEAPTRWILDGLGLLPFFAAVIGGDSLPTRKPDPAGARELQRRGGASADQILFVGDSPIDRATAQNAGVAFCAVGWGMQVAPLRAAGVPFVERPADLLDLVDPRG